MSFGGLFDDQLPPVEEPKAGPQCAQCSFKQIPPMLNGVYRYPDGKRVRFCSYACLDLLNRKHYPAGQSGDTGERVPATAKI